MSIKAFSNPLVPGILLVCLAIVLGLFVYQDYGIAFDEPTQREIGQMSYNYVFKGDDSLLTYGEKDHGVGFELPLVMLEKATSVTDSRDIYLQRHLATHLFFLVSMFCVYLLVLRLFGNKWLASLAYVMIVFHPRFYAHSFFNSKDIPFMAMFVVCFTIAEVAFRKNKWYWHLLLGVACGYTIGIRILALVLLAALGLCYAIDVYTAYKRKEELRKSVRNGLVFLGGSLLTLYISWPILWTDPVGNLVANYKSMSHFRWEGNMMYFGDIIWSTALPWTYIPAWFSITVPILWLVAGILGLASILILIVRKPRQFLANSRERNFLLYVFCSIVPVLMVIILNSVILDDWRHLYFIYPGFVLLALFFINRISSPNRNYFIGLCCFLQLADIGQFMIINHPYQQVYFNQLVSHEDEYLRKSFDFDYWGTSCKQGYEYILENDTSSVIHVFMFPIPSKNNGLILTKEDRRRIVITGDEAEADYFISNFRWHPHNYDELHKLFCEIKVLNSSVLHIYKLHD